MPKQKRLKTKYPGVTFIHSTAADGKPDKIFYIRYRRDGKYTEEKAGRQSQNGMTPAIANNIRSDRLRGGLSNQERRQREETAKKAEAGRWTIDKLWTVYSENRAIGKGLNTDTGRYEKYIKPVFGDKEPHEIAPLDVDRLRLRLSKKLSAQTVKHVLNLFTWIVRFGVKKGLCPPLPFHVQKPTVDNAKTEDLTPDQLQALLRILDESENKQVANLMKMALYTGMRRGELFRLQWGDIDFERGFIRIREPKGGKSATIPLNDAARELLQNHPKTKHNSSFVFPGKGGGQRTDIKKAANAIKEKAGIPKEFRALHGLRHVYASMLASSGAVDMYVLQKLLTHKSPAMTQRYSHLRDEALRGAANVVADFYNGMAAKSKEEKQKAGGE